MRTLRHVGTTAGALTLALVCASGADAAVAPSAVNRDRGVVTICHRTSSLAEPYVLIRVKKGSREYRRHLAHRRYSTRYGLTDYFDGLDGRYKRLADCPDWWSSELDWPFDDEGKLVRKQQKQSESQTQNLHIHLSDTQKGKYKTYKQRKIQGGKPKRANRPAVKGVREKGVLRAR
jgi:hypothetical protein